MTLSDSTPTRAWPLALAIAMTGLAPVGAADKLQYNRDVRPILSENCFRCHGPDSGSRKANLRLDKREAAIEAGAIVPNDPAASELVERVFTHERDIAMPPRASNKKLDESQKALLKRWIGEGAEYQPHWSFLAPKRPAPPEVKNPAWSKNPIDRFLLAEMETHGLSPSPEADRRTLARRVALDLTGLPPEPADVEAFVNDKAADAYERLVDKYLASPRWGEHRGRYWLDAARYGDTHGIHIDNYREMWIYRDWVINAFNANQPFDRFTIEQIAGDLLPNRTLDQQIASGFNRCNITTSEGGAINEEYLVLYTRDRTETVSQVYMGLTAGCAVCHDHKFDPLSQKEFYELAAFFNNTTQAAMDGNVQDTPPIVFVPATADRARSAALGTERDWPPIEARRPAQGRPARLRQVPRLVDPGGASSRPSPTVWPDPPGAARRPRSDRRPQPGPRQALLELADVGDFEHDRPFAYGAWVKPTKGGLGGAIVARMDDGKDFRGWDLWIENDRVGAHIIHKWPENALKVMSDTPIKPGVWTHVMVTYDGSGKAAGIKIFVDGKSVETKVASDTLKGSIRATVPLKVGQRHTTSRTIDSALIRDVRVFGRGYPAEDVAALVGASHASRPWPRIPADKRPAAEVDRAFRWWLAANDPESKALKGQLAALDREQAEIKARGTIAHVMNERPEPPAAFILFRGDYDKRRDPVKAETPKPSSPRSPRTCPRIGSAWPSGCSCPSTRSPPG